MAVATSPTVQAYDVKRVALMIAERSEGARDKVRSSLGEEELFFSDTEGSQGWIQIYGLHASFGNLGSAMCLMSTYAFQVRCEAGVGEIRFFVQASREHWFSKVCSSTEFARRESCYQHMQQCLSLSAASVEINFTTFVSLTLVSVSFKVLGLGFNIYQERKIGRCKCREILVCVVQSRGCC